MQYACWIFFQDSKVTLTLLQRDARRTLFERVGLIEICPFQQIFGQRKLLRKLRLQFECPATPR